MTQNDVDGNSELTIINEAAKLIGHSTVPEVAIGGILRLMSQMLGLNRGRVLQPLPPEEKMGIRYSYGLTPQERDRGLYQPGEGISGKVITTGREVVVQNIDEEPDFLFRAVERSTLPDGVVSFLAVPIFDDNVAIGVLGVHRLRMRPRSFDADLTVLRIVATFIAQILRINQLFNERTHYLKQENQELKGALEHRCGEHGILGDSPAMRKALRQVTQVADTPVTVLLTGESGTGKERFSHILHLNSPRQDKPFVAINCAAIPEQLLESELFGHERGAFTGAVNAKPGKVELANGGTLFLDEIGDLNLELQSKLLRVLENNVIQRVGGVKSIPVDVRIVAATHKNLQEAVNLGNFRLDLFYRLNVFPIHLPPLRAREGDVRILARHFLMQATQEYQRPAIFGNGVMERFESFNWPGNIRQLENVVKRAVLNATDGVISVNNTEEILQQESAIQDHLEAGQTAAFAGTHQALPANTYLSPGDSPNATDILHTNPFNGSYPSEVQQPHGAFNPHNITSHAPAHNIHTAPAFAGSQAYAASQSPVTQRSYSWVSEDEVGMLKDALQRAKGNKTRAAALIGMTARQFRYRLTKLNIES